MFMFDFLRTGYDKYRRIINIILLLIIFVLCSHMFCDMIDRKMTSDFADHIDNALAGDTYSLMGFLIFWSCKLTGSEYSVGYITALLAVLTVVVCAYFIKEILKLMDIETDMDRMILLSSGTIFICKLCIPDWSGFYFFESFSTQPWHNSTYILMRLFAMATILFFFRIEKDYLSKISRKDLIIFTILIFLTNFAKPNFIIAFAPIMLMILIRDFIQTRGKSFLPAFLFGLCVLAGCVILLFQSSVLYSDSADTSVSISLANVTLALSENRKYFFNIPFNLFFPLLTVLIVLDNRDVFSSFDLAMYRQSWMMLLLSMLEALFIREVGFRETHGNFRWGQQYFSYLIFVMSLIMIIKIAKKRPEKEKQVTVANYTYLLHVIFGIAYFMLICLLHYFYLEI